MSAPPLSGSCCGSLPPKHTHTAAHSAANPVLLMMNWDRVGQDEPADQGEVDSHRKRRRKADCFSVKRWFLFVLSPLKTCGTGLWFVVTRPSCESGGRGRCGVMEPNRLTALQLGQHQLRFQREIKVTPLLIHASSSRPLVSLRLHLFGSKSYSLHITAATVISRRLIGLWR